MANYCCTVRTNYFHVKDEDKFRELMSRVYGYDDDVRLWEEQDKNGNTVFAFGCYSGISGVRNAQEDNDEDEDEASYDEFVDGLQACIADGDAVIIFESGNENLRYVVGTATIITSNGYEHMDISCLATQMAAQMLNNADWTTKCDY